jgi:hypothetical protein
MAGGFTVCFFEVNSKEIKVERKYTRKEYYGGASNLRSASHISNLEDFLG